MDCKHRYVPLIGEERGREVDLLIFTCLTCGMLKVGTNTIRISDTRLDMDDKELRKAVLKDTGQKVNVLGNVSGTTTINLEDGNVVTATATGDTTFQFSNPPISGVQGELILELTNGGDHTISWPGAVSWAAGSAPSLTSSGTDTLLFYTVDGGTTYRGGLYFNISAPTYEVTPSVSSVNEGSSVTFTVTTTNVDDGTTLYWSTNVVSGTVNASDFNDGQTTGSFTITSGTGSVVRTLSNDATTEGSESFTISIRTDSVSGTVVATSSTVTINDTSETPPPYLAYGWFGGGLTPSNTNRIDRIDYANDTATASVRGSLFTPRGGLAGTGNSSHGYFAGGSSNNTQVDRIDYANDTATASVRGPLSSDQHSETTAPGNSSFGYVGGGFLSGGPTTTIDRIQYSNDTVTTTPRGPLSQGRHALASTGNSSFGYFGAGAIFGIGATSRVDRIDYANDGATASVRGPLNASRYILTGTGNSSYGYFAAGGPGGAPFSGIDRIDYSNDTATASARGPLSQGRARLAASTSSSYGWFGGGVTPAVSPAVLSTVDRIDYSNDTATAVARGPLSLARYNLAASFHQSI